MIGGGAVAGLAVSRTDVVSVLRDFEGSPVEGGQGGDETGDYAGLPYAASVAANDDNGHKARNSNVSTFVRSEESVLPSSC